MKRSFRILVLSIAGSLLPNILLASHVNPTVSNVSLLAMDTDQVLQAKNGGVTNILKPFKSKPSRIAKIAPVKVEAPTVVVEKTETKAINQTLEQFKSLKKATLPNTVKSWGYTRKTDRTRLANEVGIKNYKGTMEQNSLIKNFLLNKIKITDRKIPESVQNIEADQQLSKTINQLPVHKAVTYRGYIRDIDRAKIAEELGIKQYVGTREQNLLIKKYLQTKILDKKKNP